ncbi:MAG: hypothetical protein ACYDBB_26865 [Armatimonadota bacterium]
MRIFLSTIRFFAIFIFSILSLVWVLAVVSPLVNPEIGDWRRGGKPEKSESAERYGFLAAPAHQHVQLYKGQHGRPLGDMTSTEWVVPADVRQGWVDLGYSPDEPTPGQYIDPVNYWVRFADLSFDPRLVHRYSHPACTGDDKLGYELGAEEKVVSFADVNADGYPEVIYELTVDATFAVNYTCYIYGIQNGKPTVLLDVFFSEDQFRKIRFADGTVGFVNKYQASFGCCYRFTGNRYREWWRDAVIDVPTAKTQWAQCGLLAANGTHIFLLLFSMIPAALLLLLVNPVGKRSAGKKAVLCGLLALVSIIFLLLLRVGAGEPGFTPILVWRTVTFAPTILTAIVLLIIVVVSRRA